MLITPDISICTVVQDGDHTVSQLLDSVKRTADPAVVECIVVISGAVSDFAAALDHTYAEVKILENRAALGFSQARNQALRLATGRYFSFFDRDVIVEPQCLLRLCSFLDDHPETGMAVPRLTDANGSVLPSLRPFPSLLSILLKHSGLGAFFRDTPRLASLLNKEIRNETMPQETDWAVGSAVVFRRELIEEIGPPDGRYLPTYGDAEFCRRAKRAGWHIQLLPWAQAAHNVRERYNPFLVLDPDPLTALDRQRTDPAQLLDAARYLLTGLRKR